MKNSKMPKMLLFETDKTVQNIYVAQHEFESFRGHSHDFYEFEYVLEGEGKCFINGKEYPFRQGDVSFATPLDVHGYAGCGRLRVLTVHFRINSIDKNLSGIMDKEAVVISSSEAMRHAFDILKEADRNDGLGGMLGKKALEMIVIMFLQTIKEDKIKDMPREISYAVEYINMNFKDKIDLKTVSEAVGYSKEHFCRQFKRYTGMNFLEYLSGVRAHHAKNLLVDGGFTVTEVCYECGFGCMKSMNRVFLKKYGCSPKRYINQYLSQNNQNSG